MVGALTHVAIHLNAFRTEAGKQNDPIAPRIFFVPLRPSTICTTSADRSRSHERGNYESSTLKPLSKALSNGATNYPCLLLLFYYVLFSVAQRSKPYRRASSLAHFVRLKTSVLWIRLQGVICVLFWHCMSIYSSVSAP